MKSFKKHIIFILALIMTLCFYFVVNTAVAGVIYLLLFYITNTEVALNVFKWLELILMSIELLFTAPAMINYFDKEGN